MPAAVLVFPLMLLEAWRAARNERRQRERGGIEPRGDVYALMQLAYPGIFLAMIIEGAWRAIPSGALLARRIRVEKRALDAILRHH